MTLSPVSVCTTNTACIPARAWRAAGWAVVLFLLIGSGQHGTAQHLSLEPVGDTDTHALRVVRADTTVDLVTAQHFWPDEPSTGFYAYGWNSPSIAYAAWVSQTARRAVELAFYDVYTQEKIWQIQWNGHRAPALASDPNTGALILATNRLLEIAQHRKYIAVSPGIHQVGLCVLRSSGPTLVPLPLAEEVPDRPEAWLERRRARVIRGASQLAAEGEGLKSHLPALVDTLSGAVAALVEERTGRCAVEALMQPPQRTDEGHVRLQGHIALGDTTGTHVTAWTADVDSARIALRRVERMGGSDLSHLRDREGLRSVLRESVRSAFEAVRSELQMKWRLGDAQLGGAHFYVEGWEDTLHFATGTGLRIDLETPLAGYYDVDAIKDAIPLHVSQQAERLYVLLSVGRASRPGAPSGRCAAGEEHDLVWLAFDASRTLVDHAREAYQSCLSGLEMTHPPAPMLWPEDVDGTRLDVGVMTHDGEERHLHYDTSAPSRGIQVTGRAGD